MIVEKECRLDKFLSENLKIGRGKIAEYIKNEKVKINGKIVAKPSAKVCVGDICELLQSEIEEVKKSEFEVNFDVVIEYEDDDVLIANKPSGVATHGCESLKEASLVEWLMQKNYHLADINGKIRAGIVHRLDKDTSGGLIIAKNNDALEFLAQQLADQSALRVYLAIVDKELKFTQIESYLKRNEKNRLKIISRSKDECARNFGDDEKKWGRFSKSYFFNIAPILLGGKQAQLIAIRLQTGRTHQIRAQLAGANRFIYGDKLYSKLAAPRMLLHSFMLGFRLPKDGQMRSFFASFDEDFASILQQNKIDQKFLEEKIKEIL